MRTSILNKLSFCIILSSILLSIGESASGQNVAAKMSVLSFVKDETDMTARIKSPKTDKNGKQCSIIKLETTLPLNEFTFDGGMLGIEHTEQHKGEIWIYQSPGARYITITHKYHEPVRRYAFFEPLQEATVYIMKITASNVQITLTDNSNLQYVVLKCLMEGATVSFNEMAPEPFVNGTFSKAMPFGKHKYVVEAPLYAPTAGSIEVTKEVKEPVTIELKPKFGTISIHSTPEQLADVFIDGKRVGSTPLVIEKLASGQHSVKILKSLFFPLEDTLIVTDNSNRIKRFDLKPNFAQVNITTHPDAIILINDNQEGKGNWNGRLTPGSYKLTARMESHRESIQTLEIKTNDSISFNIEHPVPITGTLDITSDVVATISIDGKDYGTTPKIIQDVLIGKRTIELNADGYNPGVKTLTIIEGKILPVSFTLIKKIDGQTKITSDISRLPKTTYNKKRESTPIPAKFFVNYKMSLTASYGGMVGFAKRVGIYASYMSGLSPNSGEPMQDLSPGSYRSSGYFRSAITGGAIIRITKNLYIYAGGGYGTYGQAYVATSDSEPYYLSIDNGPEVEGGLMLNFKYFSIFGGYNTIISPIKFAEIHFGIGVSL